MNMEKRPLQFQVIFRPEPEGGYTVLVPSLPGCITYGRTMQKAQEMATDAIEGYLESFEKHGEDLPSDAGSLFGMVSVRDFAHA